MAGKKNSQEWNYLSTFTWQRVVDSAETVESVGDIIDLRGSDRGNDNIIHVLLTAPVEKPPVEINSSSSEISSSETSTTAGSSNFVNIELYGELVSICNSGDSGLTGEHWVLIDEAVGVDVSVGASVRFYELPCMQYKLVVSDIDLIDPNTQIHIFEGHTA